jgi:hypothetical protein
MALVTREQLLRRLQQRARRGYPAAWLWWNGELVHVGEALSRAVALDPDTPVSARGDDVLILADLDKATNFQAL